jgi:hypothetical protein
MITFEHPEALRKMIVAEIRVNSTQRSFGGANMATSGPQRRRMGSKIAEHMMQLLCERIEVLKLCKRLAQQHPILARNSSISTSSWISSAQCPQACRNTLIWKASG